MCAHNAPANSGSQDATLTQAEMIKQSVTVRLLGFVFFGAKRTARLEDLLTIHIGAAHALSTPGQHDGDHANGANAPQVSV